MINGRNAALTVLVLGATAIALLIAITVIVVAGDPLPEVFSIAFATIIGAITGAVSLNTNPSDVVKTLTSDKDAPK